MRKIIKKALAIGILSVLIILGIWYYFITNSAYDRSVFFSPNSALSNFGLKSIKTLYEYKDKNVIIRMDDNDNIKVAKKSAGLWVRDEFNSYFSTDLNLVNMICVDNSIYIYGMIREKDANTVVLSSDIDRKL